MATVAEYLAIYLDQRLLPQVQNTGIVDGRDTGRIRKYFVSGGARCRFHESVSVTIRWMVSPDYRRSRSEQDDVYHPQNHARDEHRRAATRNPYRPSARELARNRGGSVPDAAVQDVGNSNASSRLRYRRLFSGTANGAKSAKTGDVARADVKLRSAGWQRGGWFLHL